VAETPLQAAVITVAQPLKAALEQAAPAFFRLDLSLAVTRGISIDFFSTSY